MLIHEDVSVIRCGARDFRSLNPSVDRPLLHTESSRAEFNIHCSLKKSEGVQTADVGLRTGPRRILSTADTPAQLDGLSPDSLILRAAAELRPEYGPLVQSSTGRDAIQKSASGKWSIFVCYGRRLLHWTQRVRMHVSGVEQRHVVEAD